MDAGNGDRPAIDPGFADRVPDVPDIRDGVRRDLVTFVRALRRAGVGVPANAGVVAARALVTVGFDDEARARAALRAALVRSPRDADRFDRMFEEFWRRLSARLSLDGEGESGLVEDDERRPDGHLAPVGAAESLDGDTGTETGGQDGDKGHVVDPGTWTGSVAPGEAGDGDDEAVATATYSPAGRPERITVRLGGGHEGEAVQQSVEGLTRALATERGRRWSPAARGERADVRRSLRQSVSAGGAIVSVPEKRRRRSASRVLVLADVSRSVLDVLDRAFLLRWLRALTTVARNCRVFLFDDDTVEATAAFETGSAQDAVDALRDAETSWGGGTRIGNAVTTIREEHAGAVDRRTAVLILSDGLEMGDVSTLETGTAWLSRTGATVLWLNPLATAPDYEPVADGMAAALPSVDGLFAFAGPEDIEEVTRQLSRHGSGGPIGYEHDPRRIHTDQQ
ncbi:MAG: VWA domain-containing protein [Haloarculaceae archaeon]